MSEEDFNIAHALGRIEAKVDNVIPEISGIKDRLTKLEDQESQRQGQLNGMRFIISVLKTLPVGVVALLIGKEI